MARPRKSDNQISAYERIEEAFWRMLSEMPYSRITVSGLSKRAEVNHNLIYYYFENIDELAEKLFQANISEGLPQQFIGALLSGKLDTQALMNNPTQMKHIMRMRLFMRDDSAYLNGIAKRAIMTEWAASANLSLDELTDAEKMDLNFIFSGVVSILGSKQFENDPHAAAGFITRPIGQGIIATLKNLDSTQ